MKRNCNVCAKQFVTKKSRVKNGRGKYCSKVCYYDSKKGTTGFWSGKKRDTPWMIGENNYNWKGGIEAQHERAFSDCLDCGDKLGAKSSKRCVKCAALQRSPDISGENHWNWKGGVRNTKEYMAHYARLAKQRRRKAVGTYSFKEWETLLKKYNHMCLCCKQQEPFVKLTADHVIPLIAGGVNTIDNIQPLCQSCNSRKHVKVIDFRAQYNGTNWKTLTAVAV